jgi:hypothetical protein
MKIIVRAIETRGRPTRLIPPVSISVEYPEGMFSEQADIRNHHGHLVIARTYITQVKPIHKQIVIEVSL